ncbi:DUF1822 family protein [Mastigocoleus sp. MO_188.B34]|uniref:DUF1822 family protein n=1 Tax=Mastigocoleus sp. MO_188.B34 TaxID=3036635 RepID=UPI0026030DDB|nr:DUF1822 family protein [Mastigocoleus sp. MO_188.B34]MDJ0696265.1 DUF1822 family protein [Mastigocoleus sp. MO_188.B34]
MFDLILDNSQHLEPNLVEPNLETIIIFLKSQYFDKAREISHQVTGERNQWKTYLSAISLFAFEEWLQELAPDINININNSSIFQPEYQNLTDTIRNIEISNFKLCLITIDNLFDDWITVPKNIIYSPELADDLYVLVEIIEDEEKLIIHGFMDRDEVLRYHKSVDINDTMRNKNSINIPFLRFDNQMNNLLIYARFLEPDAITLPKESIINRRLLPTINRTSNIFTQSLVNLEQWWSGGFTKSWQSLEEILTLQIPDPVYLRSNHSPEYPIQKGKLFDFESLLNNKKFALVVKMKPEENEEKGVIVQIRPENEYCLPQGLKLKVTLNYNSNEAESEEVIATESDCIIQLGFCESPGKKFKVEAIYQEAVFTEEFIL